MLKRYGKLKKGKQYKVAEIYTNDEHRIDPGDLDKDAVNITNKIQSFGYEAYIVGGAVRDLLIGKKPKDFDIATSALPNKVRKIFRNSRIIGKRFRLVHVHFYEKIIEVATFRSYEPGEHANVYGSLEEDVKRRDFTMNGLYYSPKNEQLIDFVNGFKDIREKRVRSLIPLNITFVEDPVRMIRAIKYSVCTGFNLPFALRKSIRIHSIELAGISSSRLTEELFKILQSGYSCKIVTVLMKFKLFSYFLPVITLILSNGSNKPKMRSFLLWLNKLDKLIQNNSEVERGTMLKYLVEEFLPFPDEHENPVLLFKDQFSELKRIIKPMTPPNQFVENAVSLLFKENGFKVPKKTPDKHGRYSRNKLTKTGLSRYRRVHKG